MLDKARYRTVVEDDHGLLIKFKHTFTNFEAVLTMLVQGQGTVNMGRAYIMLWLRRSIDIWVHFIKHDTNDLWRCASIETNMGLSQYHSMTYAFTFRDIILRK